MHFFRYFIHDVYSTSVGCLCVSARMKGKPRPPRMEEDPVRNFRDGLGANTLQRYSSHFFFNFFSIIYGQRNFARIYSIRICRLLKFFFLTMGRNLLSRKLIFCPFFFFFCCPMFIPINKSAEIFGTYYI